MTRKNDLGQPIGDALPEGWSPPPVPVRETIAGQRVRLEPLDADAHANDLWEAVQHDHAGAGWTYMSYGPFQGFDGFRRFVQAESQSTEQIYFAYVARGTGRALGWGSYLRIEPADGCIEIGSIQMSPLIQRTAMATEALHLMIDHVFELGYRRCEWKCDALNGPSRRAALRLGFTFEGIFRQATHYKGRNRDTAWYAIIDQEWPAIAKAHRGWLDPSNFDADGVQIKSLSTIMEQQTK